MRPTGTLLVAALGVATFVASEARAADEQGRAERLEALRAEITTLQAALDEKRESVAVELRALNAARVDLDIQVRREELRVAQLQRDVEALVVEAAGQEGLEDELRPVVLAVLERLRTHIEAGLPFRMDERLASIAETERAVSADELLPSKALGSAWAFVDDELRLTRENVLDRQVVALPEGDVLAQVARLGMVAMFFQLPDGRVGRAVRGSSGTTWEVLEGADQGRRVRALFDALEKGIRVGWFELPWAFGDLP